MKVIRRELDNILKKKNREREMKREGAVSKERDIVIWERENGGGETEREITR